MLIKKGDKVLVIRYSDLKGINCIEKHLELINDLKYVWFGKIGSKPRKAFINMLEEDKTNYLILNSKNESYFCTFNKVNYTLPKDNGIPEYYKENFLDKGIEFSIFFKLTSIKKIDKNTLNNFVVASSANNLNNALRLSMSAHFLARSITEFDL